MTRWGDINFVMAGVEIRPEQRKVEAQRFQRIDEHLVLADP